MKTLSSRLAILSVVILLLASACSTPQAAAQPPAATNPPTATESPAATRVATSAPAATSATSATSAPAAASGAMTFNVVAGKTTASYKVREQLAQANLPNDAVGTTSDVSGSLVIKPDGSIDAATSKFTVGLASLQTDRSMRDNFVRRNILGTDQYPQAVFAPTQASGLASPLPQSGNVNFQLTGNLTIRDTTKPATWDVTGQVQNGVFTGKATTVFTFEDFNLQQPRVPVVLSVVDKITLEIDFTLQQAQ